MVSSLQSRIHEIADKLQLLATRYEALQEEKRLLEEQIAVLVAENRHLSESLAQARTDVEFLTMSHRLADDPEQLVLSRRRIASMIREIDRCISQLKE